MRILTTTSAVLFLTSCASLNEPDFYSMSEEEIANYNNSVAGTEQVSCIQADLNRNGVNERFCGTIEEIENRLQPDVPRARQAGFPSFTPLDESRSTNPPLRPTLPVN